MDRPDNAGALRWAGILIGGICCALLLRTRCPETPRLLLVRTASSVPPVIAALPFGKWGVLFTPTMILMPSEVATDRPAIAQAAAMMPGAFSASTTWDLLTWVKEDRYLDQSEEDFQRYHARRIQERGGSAGD